MSDVQTSEKEIPKISRRSIKNLSSVTDDILDKITQIHTLISKRRKDLNKIFLVELSSYAEDETIAKIVCEELGKIADFVIDLAPQIENFSDTLNNGEDIYEGKNHDRITEIWLGDTYGEKGIDGLKELGNELQEYIDQLKIKDFLNLCRDRIESE